jgi:hypothetical protein
MTVDSTPSESVALFLTAASLTPAVCSAQLVKNNLRGKT